MLAAAGCAPAPEVKIVAAIDHRPRVQKRVELDGAQLGDVPAFVTAHFQRVGKLQAVAAAPENGGQTLCAELPPMGYLLCGQVSARPDQFYVVELAVVAAADWRAPLEAAPWWTIDALQTTARELESLRPPRMAPLMEDRFKRLRTQAEAMARANRDPLLTLEEFIHAPKPVQSSRDASYYAPPVGPSHVLPGN